MRLLIAATVAASLFATNLLAADAVAPLPAGKPAGVKQADMGDNTVWWIVGLGVVVAGIAIIASGNSNSSGTSAVTPPTTT